MTPRREETFAESLRDTFILGALIGAFIFFGLAL